MNDLPKAGDLNVHSFARSGKKEPGETSPPESNNEYFELLEGASDCIFILDRDWTFLYLNKMALNEISGGRPLVGRNIWEVFPEARGSIFQEQYTIAMREQVSVSFEAYFPPFDAWYEVKTSVLSQGGIFSWFRNINERKAAETAVRESEALYRSVLEASADLIVVMDLHGRIELMNSAGLEACQADNIDAVRGTAWSDLWPETTKALVCAAIADAAAGKVARFAEKFPNALGETRWCDVVISPIVDTQGRVIRILSTARDVTVQREAAERLRWASEHDDLTALPNRSAFQANLQASAIKAMESDSQFGLLLVDLDHFKYVNDTLGHAAGDHLLREFARRLSEVAGPEDFVARLGGDEFAVIVQNAKQGGDLVQKGNAILSRFKNSVLLQGRVTRASASIGGAIFPRDALCARELFNAADTALYFLKESGRGGTQLFREDMREQAENAARQLTVARGALSERSVIPHYQPKVNLTTGRIAGHEALLRWHHPREGIQRPDSVAEAFKDYELSSRIGELMQRAVFAEMRMWLDQGVRLCPISINAAPAEFLRDDFAERLLSNIADFRLPPHLVEIEVTEHVFFDRSSDLVSRALSALKRAGVRIALDDFGTGYSSLSHLRDFPVDVVKIDRSFISKITHDTEISAIVSAVVGLAETLKIDVVAEGIETDHQRMLLRLMGCSKGQGYLFGTPVPAADVEHEMDQQPSPRAFLNDRRVRIGR